MIAVGTLSALGSHSGKIWRGVFELSPPKIDDPTILSELICAYHAAGCEGVYLGFTVAASIVALFIALGSALLLRHGSKQNSDPRSFLVFTASAFIFGLYTIFNQKWDTDGPKLPPINRGQLLALILSLAFFFAAFYLIGMLIGIARNAVRSIRDSRERTSQKPQPSLQTEGRRQEAASRLPGPTLLLLKWLLILFGVLVLGSIAHFVVPSSSPAIIYSKILYDMAIWFAYLLAAFFALAAIILVANFARAVLRHIATLRSRGAGESESRPPDPNPLQSKEASTRPTEPADGHRETPTRSQWPTLVLPPGSWRFARSDALAFFLVFVGLCVEYVVTLPGTPPAPVAAATGKEALHPVGFAAGKRPMPALAFWRASVGCSLTQPLAWAGSEVDGLRSSVESCALLDNVACLPATIIVAGTASLPGQLKEERERARVRGSNLARALEEDIRGKCGTNARVKTYVLNLGRYAQGRLRNSWVKQRELIVLLSRGDDDPENTGLAVQRYATDETRFAEYSACELYSASGDFRFLKTLSCSNR